MPRQRTSQHIQREEVTSAPRLKKGEEPKYRLREVDIEEADAPSSFYHKVALEFWHMRDGEGQPWTAAAITIPSKGQMALVQGIRKAIRDDIRLRDNLFVVVRGPRTYLKRVALPEEVE